MTDVLAGKIVLTDCPLVCIVNVREYDLLFLSSSECADWCLVFEMGCYMCVSFT